MNHRMIPPLASVALIVACAIACGCVAVEEQPVAVNTTVPVESGWNQATVAILEQYTLTRSNQEAYDTFNGSVVSQNPAILLDSNGDPLYYRYYVQKNGEPFYAVQVSANKLLGTTVTAISDFGYIGQGGPVNSTMNGSDSCGAETGFVRVTPIPSYSDKYTQLMLESWEAGDTYAQNVMRDAKNAGIDLSKPLSDEEQEIVGEILWEQVRQQRTLPLTQ
ncbi:hypothetical protein F8E02_00285 [Methanoculleus sp. Wushi-C6]|uniref:Lipoprotein n=1 Tax=Methanoculleus caldifontis TaxID=2651577 RepID=A0ABU3WXF8_9EURY|nr:hypothetical protein [Methanoculleus sp. Wushi-C6]MDV2480468.1 hypothetical protein [Methanoculleus sp. Wushi-C6]